VRGPYTLRGYYKASERNKEVFSPDGYYKTGDLIKRDRQGNITVAGRLKDCISRGAEKINAEEVESHIMKFSKVKNAAVVAMPDKVMGERVCAFVVPKPGKSFNLEELTDFLLKEEKIAKFKVPERLEFIDDLPVTKVGKFEKKSLRERIAAILEAERTS
jgi:non-ribosomal peptide synthetase component E (peptide arylation enzyme)